MTTTLVTCDSCGKSNTLDGAYCRFCGHTLPQEGVADARSQQEAILNEGFRLLKEGRHDEAWLAAGVALEAEPSSIKALSLKGEAAEALGDWDTSLEAYERILELSPDSAVERIKVAHLRKLITQRAIEEEAAARRKRLSLAAALATVIAVGGIGLGFGLTQSKPERSREGLVASRDPEMRSFQAPPGNSAADPSASGADTETGTSGDANPASPGGTSSGGGEQAATPETRANGTGSRNPRTLPLPQARSSDPGTEPLEPPVPGNLTLTPTETAGASAPPNRTANPEPKPETAPPTAEVPTRSNDGVIEIRPSPNATPAGTARPNEDASPVRAEALIRVAREHQQLGRYDQAADAYRKAISAGADPGVTHQRLAETYARMGRNDDAVAAYERAIAAYRRSNSARAQAAIDVCRQAVRVLRGS